MVLLHSGALALLGLAACLRSAVSIRDTFDVESVLDVSKVGEEDEGGSGPPPRTVWNETKRLLLCQPGVEHIMKGFLVSKHVPVPSQYKHGLVHACGQLNSLTRAKEESDVTPSGMVVVQESVRGRGDKAWYLLYRADKEAAANQILREVHGGSAGDLRTLLKGISVNTKFTTRTNFLSSPTAPIPAWTSRGLVIKVTETHFLVRINNRKKQVAKSDVSQLFIAENLAEEAQQGAREIRVYETAGFEGGDHVQIEVGGHSMRTRIVSVEPNVIKLTDVLTRTFPMHGTDIYKSEAGATAAAWPDPFESQALDFQRGDQVVAKAASKGNNWFRATIQQLPRSDSQVVKVKFYADANNQALGWRYVVFLKRTHSVLYDRHHVQSISEWEEKTGKTRLARAGSVRVPPKGPARRRGPPGKPSPSGSQQSVESVAPGAVGGTDAKEHWWSTAELAKESWVKVMAFDFDNTITMLHVFKGLANVDGTFSGPQKRDWHDGTRLMQVVDRQSWSELGHMRRIWQYDKDAGGTAGAFATRAFGGEERLKDMKMFFEHLRDRGVKLYIITRGFVGAVNVCLQSVGLLDFFEGGKNVYGNIGDKLYRSSWGTPSQYDLQVGWNSPRSAREDEKKLMGKPWQKCTVKLDVMKELIKGGKYKYDQVVFVDDDRTETAKMFRPEPFCRSLNVKARQGIGKEERKILRAWCDQTEAELMPGWVLGATADGKGAYHYEPGEDLKYPGENDLSHEDSFSLYSHLSGAWSNYPVQTDLPTWEWTWQQKRGMWNKPEYDDGMIKYYRHDHKKNKVDEPPQLKEIEASMSSASTGSGSNMPPGWATWEDGDGKTWYTNEEDKTYAWIRPQAVLLPGWTTTTDPRTEPQERMPIWYLRDDGAWSWAPPLAEDELHDLGWSLGVFHEIYGNGNDFRVYFYKTRDGPPAELGDDQHTDWEPPQELLEALAGRDRTMTEVGRANPSEWISQYSSSSAPRSKSPTQRSSSAARASGTFGDIRQAAYSFVPKNSDELKLATGDFVKVMEDDGNGWATVVKLKSTTSGFTETEEQGKSPLNYLSVSMWADIREVKAPYDGGNGIYDNFAPLKKGDLVVVETLRVGGPVRYTKLKREESLWLEMPEEKGECSPDILEAKWTERKSFTVMITDRNKFSFTAPGVDIPHVGEAASSSDVLWKLNSDSKEDEFYKQAAEKGYCAFHDRYRQLHVVLYTTELSKFILGIKVPLSVRTSPR